MHSKVIIASLICMLAATFNCGNRTIPNFAQKDETVAKETISRAPNDEQTDVWIPDETGNAGQPFNATISLEKEHSNFGIIQKSSSLNVQCSFYGNYASVRITPPNLSGDYFVKFGYTYGSTPVVLSTIYVICIDGHYSVSSLSNDDARASYYRNYVATSSVLSYISNRDTFNYKAGYYNAYDPARFNAEKKYSEYISGGRDDVEVSVVRTQKTNSYPSSTKLVLHANWIDTNGVSHPLVGVRADFIRKDLLIGSGVHFTNNQGQYTVTLSQSIASQYSLSKIRCRLASVCKATSVEDRFCQNYPICYFSTSALVLSAYSQVDYYFDIYAGTSDRADAYELTQIQTVPFKYANDYAEMLDTIVTRFPAENTDYYDSRHRDYFIDVQKEDAGSWDVLNHEYGHYICDKLGLARINEYRYPHDVNTPFDDDYYCLAYSEGLATYLGIAAQIYSSSAYNIPGYADEMYSDSYRNLSVDYNQFKPAVAGSSERIFGERTESSVTSVLLKMLDNVSRNGDDVALGHIRMWNVLTSVSSYSDPCDSIIDFINKAIELYPSYQTSIRDLKRKEGIADSLLPYSDIDEWTIMIYMNGFGLESDNGLATLDIGEILSVGSKPDNVNIIIETGGSNNWALAEIFNDMNTKICRFEVVNDFLNEVDAIDNADIGEESTFESFLEWGLTNYPAKKTGVVLWGHGGGLGSACGLSVDEVANACHDAFSVVGVSKLDFIGYDSCSCAMQDAAEFNSPYFDYMVASQLGVPGIGWVYNGWIDNVYNFGSVQQVVYAITDTYAEGKEGLTDSVLNLSYMAEYKNNFEEFAYELKNNYPLVRTLGDPRKGIRDFAMDSRFNDDFTGVESASIDGLRFLNAVRADAIAHNTISVDIIDAVIDSYNNVVCHKVNGNDLHGLANGMSIFYAGGTNTMNEFESINPSFFGITDPSYEEDETHFSAWRSIFFQD